MLITAGSGAKTYFKSTLAEDRGDEGQRARCAWPIHAARALAAEHRQVSAATSPSQSAKIPWKPTPNLQQRNLMADATLDCQLTTCSDQVSLLQPLTSCEMGAVAVSCSLTHLPRALYLVCAFRFLPRLTSIDLQSRRAYPRSFCGQQVLDTDAPKLFKGVTCADHENSSEYTSSNMQWFRVEQRVGKGMPDQPNLTLYLRRPGSTPSSVVGALTQ